MPTQRGLLFKGAHEPTNAALGGTSIQAVGIAIKQIRYVEVKFSCEMCRSNA